MVLSSSVTERASSGRPSRWLMLRRRVVSFWFEVEFEQAEHLRVAILFDYVNAIVLLDEFMKPRG